jgi:hypothetical protein
MQLAVAAAALLGDRTCPQFVETRCGHVQLVEHCERQRQNDEVGDDVPCPAGTVERHAVAAVGHFGQPRQPVTGPHGVAA